MTERITIRQAGGAPQPRQWDEDAAPVVPVSATPPELHVSEQERRAAQELSDENQHWQAKIGGGFTSRDRFFQKWQHKHTDE